VLRVRHLRLGQRLHRTDLSFWEIGDNSALAATLALGTVAVEPQRDTIEGHYSIFKRGIEGRLPALQREAFAPLPCRVRLPL